MNQAVICGFLGSDPDLKQTPGGASVVTFSVATNEVWTDRDGQKKEETDWHRIVAWDKLAENCKKYLAKGRQVLITGRIRTRSYDDKDGTKKYVTEIIAKNVQFLGANQTQSKVPGPSDDYRTGAAVAQPTNLGSDDIPF